MQYLRARTISGEYNPNTLYCSSKQRPVISAANPSLSKESKMVLTCLVATSTKFSDQTWRADNSRGGSGGQIRSPEAAHFLISFPRLPDEGVQSSQRSNSRSSHPLGAVDCSFCQQHSFMGNDNASPANLFNELRITLANRLAFSVIG